MRDTERYIAHNYIILRSLLSSLALVFVRRQVTEDVVWCPMTDPSVVVRFCPDRGQR